MTEAANYRLVAVAK